MSTTIVTHEPQAEVDRGLRSAQGIRWLLLVGALVVAVSVVRLLAQHWGDWPASVQFLALTTGALAVFAAGDITRHRLRLPVAGSALLFLFAALVPLLAWGAGRLPLLDSVAGWVSVLLAGAALLAAVVWVLRRTLGYRGWLYPATLGLLWIAVPLLPRLEALRPGGERGVFLAAALGLGAVVRLASRHVNRFFFHRDRLADRDRAVHLLPFALLVLVYGLAASSLGAFTAFFALPLACVAVALIDSGEEYFAALTRALGERPASWPRRSVGLLATGFAALASAVVLSLQDPGRQSLALVAAIATLRLLAWALRFRSAAAHAAALVCGVAAYHAFPALVPEAARQVYRWVIESLGFAAGSPAILSLADLGLSAALILLGFLLRRRLSPAMARVHAVAVGLQAAALLVIALPDPTALCLLAPACALLLAIGSLALPAKALIPVLYQALATTALAWGWQAHGASGDLWSPASATWLGVANLLFLAAFALLARRRKELTGSGDFARLVTFPPAAAACALVAQGLMLADSDPATAGLLLLEAAGTFLGSGLLLGWRWPVALAAVDFFGGLHLLGWAAGGETAVTLSLVCQGLLIGSYVVRRALPRGHLLRPGLEVLSVLAALGGLLWLGWAATMGEAGVEVFHLALLGLALADNGLRRFGKAAARPEGAAASRSELSGGLGLLAVYVPAQLAAAGLVTAPAWLLLVAGGWLAVVRAVLLHPPLQRRLSRFYAVSEPTLRDLLAGRLAACGNAWRWAAVLACLVWTGTGALVLASWLVADLVWRAHRAPLVDPEAQLVTTLLPVLQLAALPEGGAFLLPALFDQGIAVLPGLAWLGFAWQVALTLAAKRLPPAAGSLVSAVEGLLAAGTCLALFDLILVGGNSLSAPQHLLLVAVALARAAWHLTQETCRPTLGSSYPATGWLAQGWIALAVLQAHAAGWLAVGVPLAGLALLTLAVAETALAEFLSRDEGRARPCRTASMLYAVAATWLAVHTTAAGEGSPWLPILPGFLASAFFVLLTLRERSGRQQLERFFGAGLAAVTFMVSFTVLVHHVEALGRELYCLGPGFALLGLSALLRRELGERWSLRLFTAGAVCLYAMPVLGLLAELDWLWQIVLLLFAVAFGAASFLLRSRSLLIVSTAALIVDLAFFLLHLRSTAPQLLWVAGIFFGLGLMGTAALLEYRRERVLQRIRVWGREIRSWA